MNLNFRDLREQLEGDFYGVSTLESVERVREKWMKVCELIYESSQSKPQLSAPDRAWRRANAQILYYRLQVRYQRSLRVVGTAENIAEALSA